MSEPRVNVDHFYHRPTGDVVGLLIDKPEIPAISADLESAGTDVAAVEILCGEQGAGILDQDGATTGCKPGWCEPCSGSAMPARPRRSTTRRSGTVTCCCTSRCATLIVSASRRCSSATRPTIWATSAQARSSSSRSGLISICPPEEPAASPTRPARTSCRARRPPKGRSRRATRSARGIRQPLSPLTSMAASNLGRKVVAPAMAQGPGNLSRRVARQHYELGLTREQVAYRAGMAASGLPLLSHALREPAAMPLSFKPGELQTYERETDIMQAIQGRATVLTREDKHTLGVGDVLVILSGTCPTSSWCHRPVPLLCDKGTGLRLLWPPELMRGRPGQRHQTIGDTGRQVAPGLDWTKGVVVTGDCRRGQTVQPAVMAISRLISAVPGSYIRVRYLTVGGWWP